MPVAKSSGKRGRPMGDLRKWAKEYGPKLANWSGEKEFSIITGKLRNGKPDYLLEPDGSKVKLPNNHEMIPSALFGAKNLHNVVAQIGLGLTDAKVKASIGHREWDETNAAKETVEKFIVYVFKKEIKKETKTPAKKVVAKK